MAPPWKKTYLDHGGSTSCGSRVFCRSVAASDQYNPCQWKPAIYGRADRGVYFRFAAEPESGILLSAVPLPAAQVNSVRAGLQAGVPQPVGRGGDRLREECGWLRFLHEQPDVF